MRLHASPCGFHSEALEGDISSLAKEELPPAAPTGACGLPLDVVWDEGVMRCCRQPFWDNEEGREN